MDLQALAALQWFYFNCVLTNDDLWMNHDNIRKEKNSDPGDDRVQSVLTRVSVVLGLDPAHQSPSSFLPVTAGTVSPLLDLYPLILIIIIPPPTFPPRCPLTDES